MLQGPPGKKGEPGTCTCNATALMASFTMPKMIQGPKGEQGVPGQEGKQGQMGLTVLTLCKNQTLRNKKNNNDDNSIMSITLCQIKNISLDQTATPNNPSNTL